MKRLLKKGMPLLLTVIMVISMLPGYAQAEETDHALKTAVVKESAQTCTVLTPQQTDETEKSEEGLAIDKANFPDGYFRTYVSDYCDKDKNGYLSETEIAAVTYIGCWKNRARSLEGIGFFTELTRLDCFDDELTELDLSKNANLEYLNCNHNPLTAVDVGGCEKLNYLLCIDNIGHVEIDISGCTILLDLYLNGTRVDDEEEHEVIFKPTDSAQDYRLHVSKGTTIITGLPAAIVISETNFPDVNFRAYVSENCDTDQNGYLSEAEIAAVKEIDCSSAWDAEDKIASLRGVEYFTALTSLNCQNNQLTTLDMSSNTALTYLSCDWNQLTALDVSSNTALTYLNCDWNQLTALDVSANTALTDLNCGFNQLTVLDVSANTALTRLSCYNNQLTTLDVSNDTALTELSCSNNQLTALDVSANTALTELSCYGNQLTTLDVSANTALTRLSCYNNQLTALDVSNNTALTHLDCGGNQLTALDVSSNTALTQLSCYSNQLTALDVSANTALTFLDCRGNQLTALDVRSNTALTDLYCFDNQLTTLDVSSNTALTSLYCYGNQLTALDVSANTALRRLSCHNNQLTALDISQCPKLLKAFRGGAKSRDDGVVRYYVDAPHWEDSCFLAVDETVNLITWSEPIELWVEDDTVTVQIAPLQEDVSNGVAFCAGYDSNGKMLWIRKADLTPGEMETLILELQDGTVSVKAMVVDSRLAPLFEAVAWTTGQMTAR